MKRSFILAVCLLLMLGASSTAKDWFVNPATGVDAWPGFGDSPSFPFASISFCFSGIPPVVPADRVICAPGLYNPPNEIFPILWSIPDVEILGVPDNPLARTILSPAGFGSSTITSTLAPHTPRARFDGFTIAGDCFNGIFITGPAPGIPSSPTISNNVFVPSAINCTVSLSTQYGPHFAEVVGNYIAGGAGGACVFGTTDYAGDIIDTNLISYNYYGHVVFGGGLPPALGMPLMRSNCVTGNFLMGMLSLYGAPSLVNETQTYNSIYGIYAVGGGTYFDLPNVLNSTFQYHVYDLYGFPAASYYMGGSNFCTLGAPPYLLTGLGNPLGGLCGVGIAADGCHLLPGSPLIDAGFDMNGPPPIIWPIWTDFFGRSIWGSSDIDGEDRWAPGVIPYALPVLIDVGADEVNAVRACKAGNVNDLTGPITDVLYVNGTTGGPLRETTQDSAQWLNVFMTPAPVPAINNKYYVGVFPGEPDQFTFTLLPKNLGFMCFTPVNVDPAYVMPLHVANNITGKPTVDPACPHATGDSLPGNVLEIPPFDVPPGTELTVQGIIGDGNSTANPAASVTNAVDVIMN